VLTFFKKNIRGLLTNNRKIQIHWANKGETSWLSQQFIKPTIKPKKSAFSNKIERIAQQTNDLGPQQLWEGYASNNTGGPTRMPDWVRTADVMGDFYTLLVKRRKPKVIVEFGTAFGVSGMYFLAGLNDTQSGELFTFEPNSIWAECAKNNLSQISDRFVLTVGTFEENIDKCLPNNKTIDIAFIDAIHTKEFVAPQLDIVISRSSKNALIILDDINFSQDMREYWDELSTDNRFSASLALGNRVGILELKDFP